MKVIPRRLMPALVRLLVIAAIASGCSVSQSDLSAASGVATPTGLPLPAGQATQPPVVASPTPTTSADTIPVSPTSVRDAVLSWFNGEVELAEPDFERMFDASFRAVVPYAEMVAVNAQMQSLAPWQIEGSLGESPDGGAYRFKNRQANLFVVQVVVTEGKVSGLSVRPWADPPATIDQAMATIESLGAPTILVAETTDESCRSIIDRDAETIQPLGSVFKLLVLGALIDAVESGEIEWEQPVTIRDELDSYPSGTTQDVAAGTSLTVRELAELMISISDNTATDHIIHLLGRETIEATQTRYGVAEPELNQPFLSTREIFALKLDDELRSDYISGNQAERRAIAESLADAELPPIEEVMAFASGFPIDIETVEWFATPNDLCRVLTMLASNDNAREILAINPGVPDETARWEYVGFKGGSEPGVLAVAWLVEDSDGRSFTITGGITAPGQIPEIEAVQAFAAVRDLFNADLAGD